MGTLAAAPRPRTRRARQSAFADAKERVAAHLRASSKRVAPPFRPFGPDAPAGHERPLSRDTNFELLSLSLVCRFCFSRAERSCGLCSAWLAIRFSRAERSCGLCSAWLAIRFSRAERSCGLCSAWLTIRFSRAERSCGLCSAWLAICFSRANGLIAADSLLLVQHKTVLFLKGDMHDTCTTIPLT